MMSHKDYRAIAHALAETSAPVRVVLAVAHALVGTNPNYDMDKFTRVARGGEEK
jgi:hypothetical protein